MAGKNHDRDDAMIRARAEVMLELGRWVRRIREKAEDLTDEALRLQPNADPVEVGRAAALDALNSDFYVGASSKQSAIGQ